MDPQGIRVLIVDDSSTITTVYRQLFDRAEGFCCAGVLNSTKGLLSAVRMLRAGIVLLDMAMPGESPLLAMEELAGEAPDVRCIAFTGYDDAATVDAVLDAGGWGVISKSERPQAVLSAIRRVVVGEVIRPGAGGGDTSPDRTLP